MRSHYPNMFHAVDIVPTILAALGSSVHTAQGLDGVSHWEAVTGVSQIVPRTHMIYNIDDELVPEILNIENRTSAFQVGKSSGEE